MFQNGFIFFLSVMNLYS